MTKKSKLYHSLHHLRLEKALILTLFLLLVLFHTIPKRFELKPRELLSIDLRFKIQDVPSTRQLVRRGRPAPKRPTIPLPVEDPSFPEDATIEETNIKWNMGDAQFGNAGITTGKNDTIPPRPLMQVMPEYPNQLRKQKIHGNVRLLVRVGKNGKVKDVVVAENATGSELCEKIATKAAWQSRYIPATWRNKRIEMWTTCTYSFAPK
ncbi:MAG: TonB family protein [Actinobacteria bacterium]|nr:TonB family protein [Actinomycetota bacterium]